jgi:hypothetical protein
MRFRQIIPIFLVLLLLPSTSLKTTTTTVFINIAYDNILEIKTYFPDLSFAIDEYVGRQETSSVFHTSPTNIEEYNGDIRMAEWSYKFNDKSSGNISFYIDALPTTNIFTGNMEEIKILEWEKERYLGNVYIKTNSGETIHLVFPNNKDIMLLSKTIVGSENRPYYKAKLIYEWMVENINVSTNSNKYPQTAIDTLAKKSGDCDDLTYLYISLLRASGVPCYSIDGIILSNSNNNKNEIIVKNLHTIAAFIMPSDEKIFEPVFVDIINEKFNYKGTNFIALGFDPGGIQSLDYFTKVYWGVEYSYEKADSGSAEIKITLKH